MFQFINQLYNINADHKNIKNIHKRFQKYLNLSFCNINEIGKMINHNIWINVDIFLTNHR